MTGTVASPKSMITLENVTKRYPNGHVAVADLSLEIARGEIAVLVGPSGCGKTTTMKMINRLIEPTSGRIYLDGENVVDADPVMVRRHIGYVIQQVGLFPHQTVAANVGTVPRLLGWDKARIAARVDELLDLVGLDRSYRDRYPRQLSGGQQQRVGVARALGADPPVLLMDEPFGAIDPINRTRLQDEFIRLQNELHKTVVFVTHDIEEAVKLGDRIAILAEGGVLEQYATPDEILADPANEFVADFVGRDRGLKLLSVTPLSRAELVTPPALDPEGGADQWSAAMKGLGAAFGIVGDSEYVTALDPSNPRPLPPVLAEDSTLRDALAAILLAGTDWVPVNGGEGPTRAITHDAILRYTQSS